jgi:uncharacterized protein YjbJ (UPF0337 family)
VSAQKTNEGADKLKASVKEAIGKLVGDPKVEAEGKLEQNEIKRERASPQKLPGSLLVRLVVS